MIVEIAEIEAGMVSSFEHPCKDAVFNCILLLDVPGILIQQKVLRTQAAYQEVVLAHSTG